MFPQVLLLNGKTMRKIVNSTCIFRFLCGALLLLLLSGCKNAPKPNNETSTSEPPSPSSITSLEDEEQPQEDTPSVLQAEVHFLFPDDEVIVTAAYTEAPAVIDAPEPPVYDGYTFLGWRTEEDELITGVNLQVQGTMFFAAEYDFSILVDPEDTAPYLSLSDDGFFFPNRLITEGEALAVLSECFAPGVFSQTAEDPEAGTSLRALLPLLTSHLPQTDNSYHFAFIGPDDACLQDFSRAYDQGWIELNAEPDLPLDRLTFARLMNRVKGRKPDPRRDYSGAGNIMDLPRDSEDYQEAAEAAIEHTLIETENGSSFIAVDPLPAWEPGMQLRGTTLYYIQEDGTAAVDKLVQNCFQFDADGHYTSGEPALDYETQRFLQEIIDQLDEGDVPERFDLLHHAYTKMYRELFYCKGNIYDPEDSSWYLTEATEVLSSRSGNCFGWSAAFYALGRSLGYDTRIVAGGYRNRPGGAIREHCWNEIYFEGESEPYTFDTQLNWNLFTYEGWAFIDSRWMMSRRVMKQNPGYIYPENYTTDNKEGE